MRLSAGLGNVLLADKEYRVLVHGLIQRSAAFAGLPLSAHPTVQSPAAMQSACLWPPTDHPGSRRPCSEHRRRHRDCHHASSASAGARRCGCRSEDRTARRDRATGKGPWLGPRWPAADAVPESSAAPKADSSCVTSSSKYKHDRILAVRHIFRPLRINPQLPERDTEWRCFRDGASLLIQRIHPFRPYL